MPHSTQSAEPHPGDDPIFETIPMPERGRTKDTLWWAVIGVAACASAVGLALVLVT